MKRLIILGLTSFMCSLQGFSQVVEGAYGYFNDALLFSQTQSFGTARMQAIAGAQAALGGDVNSAYANPAGLGFVRKSMVTITPSMNFYNSESEYFDMFTSDSKENFNVANLGVVFSFAKRDIEKGKFRGGSFAITLTRENNFHRKYNYGAYNPQAIGKSSIIDSWVDRAWGIHEDNLRGILQGAYDHYLISPYSHSDDPSFTIYDKYIGNQFTGEDRWIGDNPFQEDVVEVKGRQQQWDFSYGGNFDDILYFGASLSLNSIQYEKQSTFTEWEYLLLTENINDNIPDDAINNVSTRSTLEIRGRGISGTMGFILRPVDFLRIGVSATTPTGYDMTEESSQDLVTSFNDWEYSVAKDSSVLLQDFYNEYFTLAEYKLRTPGKVTAGTAFFLGKYGFISADVDWINYSKARYKSDDFEVDADNQTIKNIYQNTMNFRVGGEVRVNKVRLRGGYSYQGDPFVDSVIDNSVKKITGGIGFRSKAFFVDLAAVHSQHKTLNSPYNIYDYSENVPKDISPVAFTVNKNLNISLTVGVNF